MSQIYFSSWGNEIIDNRGKAPQQYATIKNITLPVQFIQDQNIKALIGWYGIVLRSPDVDIIELCCNHMNAIQKESCGKCFPCRIGTRVISQLLTKIYEGKGKSEDLNQIENLASTIIQSSKCSIGQTGPVPILHAIKFFRNEFDNRVNKKIKVTETLIYKSKLTAPCMDACPFHLDIPLYVERIKEGNFQKSLDTILEKLPIPGVLGRVCIRPCEENCRRKILDKPVSIKLLKRFVTDYEISKWEKSVYNKNPSKKAGRIAIVGSGPAGITCAYHLALKGHQVTIYEKLGEPGGMSAIGIPDFRLPREIIKYEYEQIQKLGVKLKFNSNIGTDIGISQLEKDNDAVLIAVGAHLGMSMRVEGEKENYPGYIPGVKYLLDINSGRDPYPDGKKVVVVGGGNVAIDCVRSSFRVNKPDVNLIYRRTKNEMPADAVEIKDAEEENVIFHYLTNPTRIITKDGKVSAVECIRMELGKPDDSGRRRPVPIEGSEFQIDCDIIVPAIGQAIDLSVFKGMDDIDITKWNTVKVNEITKQTNLPKIFSAGDCETGPGDLITACAGGMKAALSIDRLINNKKLDRVEEDNFDKLLSMIKVFDSNEQIGLPGGRMRYEPELLSPQIRKTIFDEVEKGFTVKEARLEADRCLRCYYVMTLAL